MNRLPPLNALVAFRAVMETGSLVAAASKLSITASAVSHRLKALEDHLGLELFERRSRAVFPTAAAYRYSAEISEAFDRIASATRAVETVGNRDTLSIHCSNCFASNWLLKRVLAFGDLNEDLSTIVSCVESDGLDPENGQFDLYFRHGGDLPDGYDSLPIGHERVRPLISPLLLEKIGYPRKPADLLDAPMVVCSQAPVSWEDWLLQAGVRDVAIRESFVCDQGVVALEAARQGFGVVLASGILSAELESMGQLVPLFPEYQMEGAGYHLMWREKRREEDKIAKFCNWLERQLESGDALARANLKVVGELEIAQ
ncbi:LysR substrate-binding domain-containing protein [Polycladidibacter hongkongensis]|uniref:LysR substrate-binding domain-containing protein n=1 Tax=Polycladidibacter hongkongensis TaxID=1647556 RepID=UPI0009EBE4FC|nr:LysR substrate-binding domain-containing protein [Pseudovibrio hongkongensis]